MQQITQARETLSGLTTKQRDVLDLVLVHKSSKEIARSLNISHYTVDQRVAAARQKLGVDSRGELARAYSQLREICGETAYGFSDVALTDCTDQLSERDQSLSPIHTLSDALPMGASFDWYDGSDPKTGLEALDKRYGIFGRIVAIIGLAALIALMMLAMVAIAQSLTMLI